MNRGKSGYYAAIVLAGLLLGGCKDEQQRKAEQAVLVQTSLDNMITVKGGRFQMGDFGPLVGEKLPFSPEQDTKPLHWVALSDFRMGKYRVTWGEFNRWLAFQGRDKNNYYKRIRDNDDKDFASDKVRISDNYPASVSWHDAKAYCRWLGTESGRNLDLPTEAQWEYAARSRGQFLIYANSDNRYYYGDDNARNFTPVMKPVGSYAPNPLGLYDMMGNGTDWINDWYAADYYQHSPEKDPQGPGEGTKKVQRGYQGDIDGTYTIYRAKQMPADESIGNGFRCVENSPLK
ncbi:SUMF1/EgtB/PvdO family nonheme iron enzyme [Brenneria goodwinii]|uniref:formylglycine-generating enzyme family protein n=3 Tax=Brenneria goodwinii TaxID=1109412 RepID=UPI000EF1BD12|nr:SUMF1/EgtB/PvdO family nonheme iron enzyme [Brenneria goodwinii]MCG8157346.1 SUMF1/EgtB/PvdO family nonheme iron enzyme [Brenneria goodwinii]MCG8165160.1 SUMF1/EgtB/PvdO family nonheme iron enzyme [Brenneria goodwinii]MCG8170872.1 SUMF1/EgtB/PvdO family nonheme iron enzyme [Brenneria goodwinii]MCG8175927.1 SUMF1/EgtB/PvdO family nonheme iron enzyme [Brenneria goodwinii]MCG8178999.1 SUMF1/EgtB/PvdO family nonheme iron enzyme [Brenneria goodwinii]